MSEDSRIIDAARAVRPHLSELLGPDRAAAVDADLAHLLNASPPLGDIERLILEALARHPATHGWAATFLEHGTPPDLSRVAEKGYQAPPGTGSTTTIPRFACPQGDYVWYRRSVGEPIPACPSHRVALLLQPAR
jgi:hypothetical protein